MKKILALVLVCGTLFGSQAPIFDTWGAEGGPRDNGDKAVLCGYGQ